MFLRYSKQVVVVLKLAFVFLSRLASATFRFTSFLFTFVNLVGSEFPVGANAFRASRHGRHGAFSVLQNRTSVSVAWSELLELVAHVNSGCGQVVAGP